MSQVARTSGIKPGCSFRQRSAGMIVSTARVVAIENDARGIPHVTFELNLKLPSGASTREDRRTLALDRFAALYPLPV